MEKFKIIIEVVKEDNVHIICTYNVEHCFMFEALQKARFLASMQLEEEHADYIKRVEVVKLEKNI